MPNFNKLSTLAFLLAAYTVTAVDFPRLREQCSSDADCMDEVESCMKAEE